MSEQGPVEVDPIIDTPRKGRPPSTGKKNKPSFRVPVDESQEAPPLQSKPPTRDEVIGMLTTVGMILAVTVDEKFSPLVIVDGDDGPFVKCLKPQVEAGADQMMPWMAKYGATLGTLLIWSGLITGMAMAYQDGLKEIPKFVSGKKKPIFMRDADEVDEKPQKEKVINIK